MKIQKENNQHFITIPITIIRGFSWKKGDNLNFKIVGAGKVELEKAKE